MEAAASHSRPSSLAAESPDAPEAGLAAGVSGANCDDRPVWHCDSYCGVGVAAGVSVSEQIGAR